MAVGRVKKYTAKNIRTEILASFKNDMTTPARNRMLKTWIILFLGVK